jgi:thiol-disulfide isomerase/thioredoxin
MTRRPLRAALALALAGLLVPGLAGCATAPRATGPGGHPAAGGADLAAAQARARLAACPRPGAAVDSRGDPGAPAVAASASGLPDVPLPCLAGGPDVVLARLSGVPTVLNGWASWCVPCRAELPAFQRLSAAAGGRLRVLGVDTEDAAGAAVDFAAARGVRFPSVFDATGRLRTLHRVAGLPFTLFVRADGTVAEVHVGPLEYTDLAAEAARQLGVRVG